MSSLAMSGIVFACICVGTFLAMILPGHHLEGDTKDVIRLGTGLVATIAALVLGLLIGSAKASYDTKGGQVRHLTADIIVLDQFLSQYGPEAHAARELLRQTIAPLVDRIWHENSSAEAPATPFEATAVSQAALAKIQELVPHDEAQSSLKARTIQMSTDLAQTRILLYTQANNAIPMPFLAVLVFWLMIIFASFSLFARPNAIVVACLLVFALSAAGAIFLILELNQPFAGLMAISNEPLRQALAPLGS